MPMACGRTALLPLRHLSEPHTHTVRPATDHAARCKISTWRAMAAGSRCCLRRKKRWPAFCATIGRAELSVDLRFTTGALRMRNAAELVTELDAAFALHDWPHWRARLAVVGAAIAPIARTEEFVDDVQAQHAGIIVPTDVANVPRTLAAPVRLGFAKPRPAGPAPALGQHTNSVLRELGYSDSEIAALRDGGGVA